MKKMKGDASKLETDEDIYDNEYEKSFWSGYGSYSIWYDTDVTFNLNKAYNTFTATLYSRSSKNEAQYMTAEIYADGKVIYQNLKFEDITYRLQYQFGRIGNFINKRILKKS